MSNLGEPMDGLVLVQREDGAPAVRLAALAPAEEVARAAALRRDQRWLLEQGEADEALPPEMRQAVEDGATTMAAVAAVIAKRNQVRAERASAAIDFFQQLSALRGQYPDAASLNETMERAWWDGLFDRPGDPPVRVPAGRVDDVLAAAVAVALRLAGGDEERAGALMVERPRRVTGPESVAIMRAAAVVGLRDEIEDAVRERGWVPHPDDPDP